MKRPYKRPIGPLGGKAVTPGAMPQRRPMPTKPQPAPTKAQPPATDWGEVSQWYDTLVGDEGSEYQRHVVLPGAARLLALQPGNTCVDVACGQGVLCRMLSDRGVRMTGVDAAHTLIDAARARERERATETGGASTIEYIVGDARDLSFLTADSFDAAACLLAIQNIHPIGPVFAGVARALKPNGKFVLVMMHPCFRGPKETEWGWDEKAAVQYRRVDRYLLPRKSPIVTNPGIDPDKYTWTFHKPIEAYVRAARGAGLLIDALEEWPSHKNSDSGPRAAAENAARKEIPMFLALRAIKVAGLAPTAATQEG